MSPDTRAFLDRVRDAENPTSSDEERVLRALEASLAAGLTASTLGSGFVGHGWFSKMATSLGSFGSKLSVVAVVGVSALGAGDTPTQGLEMRVDSTRPASAAPMRGFVPAPSRSIPVPRETSPGPPKVAASAAVSPSSTSARKRPQRASLRAELDLLRDVQAALQQGDGQRALRMLDAHAIEGGALHVERAAARVLALCLLNDREKARRAVEAFTHQHPGSVHAAAIAKSCAGSRWIERP